MNIVLAPCGCTVVAEHDKGDRLTRCGGHPANGSTGCRGGISYAVRAQITEKVTYSVRALTGAS